VKNIRDFSFYEILKGPKNGYCAICNQYGKLTYDHIPPKSCGNESITRINFPHNNKQTENANRGLRFRTICADCNNRRLGILDDNFNKTVKEYRSYVESKLIFNGKVRFDGDINLIKRFIIGHILAGYDLPISSETPHFQETSEYRKKLLQYFNNDNSALPDTVKIHYWVHNYNNIVFSPAFLYIANLIDEKSIVTCSLLKFYPFGFLIVDYGTTTYRLNLPELKSCDTTKFDLCFNSDLFLHYDYPFNVNQGSAIMSTKHAVHYSINNSDCNESHALNPQWLNLWKQGIK